MILLNEKLTLSTTSVPVGPSPASMLSAVTRPFSMVILRYSSGLLPALRTVSTAFVIISLVRSAAISAVDAESMVLTILSSQIDTRPVGVFPPARLGLPCIPHDQL